MNGGEVRTALMDASSAILLHKGGLFTVTASSYRVAWSPSVADEVTAPGHIGSEAFARMLEQKVIAIVAPPASRQSAAPFPSGLHTGERDTLAIYLAGHGDFIVLDDGKAAAFCRDAVIPYLNALLLPRVLYLAGRISHDTCLEATTAITAVGRYADWVIRYAREAEDTMLRPFLPLGTVATLP